MRYAAPSWVRCRGKFEKATTAEAAAALKSTLTDDNTRRKDVKEGIVKMA